MLAHIEVTDIVFFMTGAIKQRQNFTESFYTGFRGRYPTPEKRREAAKTLIPGTFSIENWSEYYTRTVLAAQWGDSLAESFKTAEILYSLEPTLVQNMGQSVLKLSGITFSELRGVKTGGKLPPYGFSIDVGAISNDTSPEYAFRRTPQNRMPSSAPENSTFLDFQVSLPVIAGGSIEVYSDGSLELNPSYVPTKDFVAYSGTVSLEDNTELYRKTRQTEVGNLVFGNRRSFGIVYELMRSVGGEHFNALRTIYHQGNISPDNPILHLDSVLQD